MKYITKSQKRGLETAHKHLKSGNRESFEKMVHGLVRSSMGGDHQKEWIIIHANKMIIENQGGIVDPKLYES